MIDPITTKAISATILAPAINFVLNGAKKIGAKGLEKWGQTKYHTKIQKKIASIESLKTFWSQDKLVTLQNFYYPSRIEIEGTSKQCQLLSELPTGNLIIEGIVGQGKSIYLRHLATSEIRSNQSKFFPIFIEFRTISKKIDLELAIKNYLEDVNIDGFNEETFEYVMSSGNFVLLLDAFDEIDDDVTKDTYLQIDRYCEKYENLKIIVTSRPSAEIQKSSKFKIIKLSPLREADYTPFLAKLGLSSQFIAELKRSIKSSPSKISHLIRTPLMLTLVVLAYRSVKEIPENLPDFFEVLFKCVFSGHDNAKPYIKRALATDLSEKKLQELFEAFCFVCIKDRITRSLTTEQFDRCFESAKRLLNFAPCEANDFRHDMNKVACLILPDGFDTWVFLHKSVMEYYAASFVRKSSENFANKFFKFSMREPAYWMEVLTFLHYIDEYRFNKYYLLDELAEVFSEINLCEESYNSEQIIAFFEANNVNLSLTLDVETTPDFEDFRLGGGFGAGKSRFCTRNIIHAPLFKLLSEIAEQNIKVIDDDFLAHLRSASDEDNRVVLDLRQVLKLYGEKEFLQDFQIFLQRLKQKRHAAFENIQLHESRCAFLDS